MTYIEHNFNNLIKDFGSHTFLYPVFDLYEQRGTVGNFKSIRFEIRPKEQGHPTAHIHAYYENLNISISLEDFSILAGNIPHKQSKIAVEWVKNNIDFLRSKWNEYHIYNIPVFN